MVTILYVPAHQGGEGEMCIRDRCHTCVKGAEYNVAINAGMIRDPDRAAPLFEQRDRLRREADTLSGDMMKKVEDKLG